ncbi:MAG TPA: hypothetical protein VL326_05720 [Kofleriaceae bacterium]|nr:hypothetical protein [Kofleriaceae bacterium]
MMYRNDIEAIAARKQRLESELKAKTRELDATGRLLDEAKAKAKLPVLPNIRVASPCTADWNAMTPADVDTERVRHCGSCQKNVYNLSQMTRDEAEALILAKEGRLCVRYFQRKDGTILLKDCTIGVSNGRKRKLIAAGAAAILASGAGAAAYVMTRGEDKHTTMGQISDHEIIQGGMEAPVVVPDELTERQGDLAPSDDVEVHMGGMPAPSHHDVKKPPLKHQVNKKRIK